MKKISKREESWFEYLFKGFNYCQSSNKYMRSNRISDDSSRVLVKVADCHLKETMYGYALILDAHHVVFLKKWQVNVNYYGNEVMLDKKYWNVKEWGDFTNDFVIDDDKTHDFNEWLNVAEEQQMANNYCYWAI